jgi:hypothetical protein
VSREHSRDVAILRESHDTGAVGVYFATYEATKRALCPEALANGIDEPMWVEAVGGATTGAITWLVRAPMPDYANQSSPPSLPECWRISCPFGLMCALCGRS